MITKLHEMGLRSNHAYALGFASIAASWLVHAIDWAKSDKEQADRWGLYVGEWAPTLIAIGVALKLEENDSGPLSRT